MQYNFIEIEQKWREIWKTTQAYKVANHVAKPTCYVLDMFPYPSGAGLHVGHPLGYIASDIYARYKRLKGFNVLHPMGFDSFGLPAEQYALETGQHPNHTTEENIARYKMQLDNIGFCYDWSREVRTSDPSYYTWTQWIFLQLYQSWYNPATNKAEPIETLIQERKLDSLSKVERDSILAQHRLAYRAESYVNWCAALGTVLANDEVINGVSERGGHPVERKKMSQWFLRITSYAERLLEGLLRVDFPESLREMQRNWIGKSVGAEIEFAVANHSKAISVFTTRPDTLFGVSFLVLAPEHEMVTAITSTEQMDEVNTYQQFTKSRSERERMAETKKISGCFTGAFAIHPITKQPIPIWISEYVLAGYGTGAIMAVPCGDERDFQFAKFFNLPIPIIFKGIESLENAYSDKSAKLVNSDFLNDLEVSTASEKAIEWLELNHQGKRKINFRMRDAGFSRQRYWGEPFPILYEGENELALEASELPLTLPYMENYSAGPNGKGPLANNEDWMFIRKEGKQFVRESDTMPGFAGSSWYYLRYMDPQNKETFCSREASDYWQQVDLYVGGAEHAVGHLLYSRMWCKVLFDLGFIGFDEPYKKLLNQGMIQGNSRLVYRIKGKNTFVSYGLKDHYEVDTLYTEYKFCTGVELDIEQFKNWKEEYKQAEFILEDGKYICGALVEKMSKRLFNVVNPDEVIAQYGTDTFRMYEMFLGPIDVSKPWDTQGIEGVHRFLRKAWRLFVGEDGGVLLNNLSAEKSEQKLLHQTIRKIEQDIENFSLNTAVSQFMICVNELARLQCHKREILLPFLQILTPFAPHFCEELWQLAGQQGSILDSSFPMWEEQYLVESSFIYPVAINGKTRTELEFALDATQTDIEPMVLQNAIVLKWLDGKPVKKFIYVKGKMINVVM